MTILGPFAALDHVFQVDVTSGDDPTLAALFAPLATDRPATHTYQIALPDGDAPGWLDLPEGRIPKDEVPSIHSRLLVAVGLEALASTTEPILHGCLVEVGGVGILVAGRSGSGKSTLTARLLAGGAALVTEDLTAIDAQGQVRAYPRPVALSSTAYDVLGIPLPEDDCGCGCMKYAVHPSELGGRVGPPRAIDLVAICDRTITGVVDLTHSAAMAALFQQGSVANVGDDGHLGRVASALAGARCAQVGTEDLDAAVAALTALAREPRSAVVVGAEPIDGGTVAYLDGEALIHLGDVVHHLDATSTAVWVLQTEGLSPESIAVELGCDAAVVDDTLQLLRDLELPVPVG
jgi:hypothetical protein